MWPGQCNGEYMVKHEILVFIPTYNERENVEKLYQKIKEYKKDVDILFCDDNSPDGTGKVLDLLAEKDRSVRIIHRLTKSGLGTAHLAAFEYAQKNNYRYLITMDADFTHDPLYISSMIAKKDQADIIIGSRYIAGGEMSGWGKLRLPFTYFWRALIKSGLGMPYDCTGAFRLYNVKKLKPDIYKKISSKGFSFCIESLYRMREQGLIISEIPIHARNREHGASKLSFGIMKEAAITFCRLFLERRKKR
jgi:dolichol-phosphate mannosyltransferase